MEKDSSEITHPENLRPLSTNQQQIESKKKSSLSKLKNAILGDIYADDNPNEYSESKKNFIILLVALSGIAGPMSSMMYMPGLLAVASDLNTSTSAVNGSISAFVVFMGISVCFDVIFF